MQVKMIKTLRVARFAKGGASEHKAGQVVDVPEAQAIGWIKRGWAEPVETAGQADQPEASKGRRKGK